MTLVSVLTNYLRNQDTAAVEIIQHMVTITVKLAKVPDKISSIFNNLSHKRRHCNRGNNYVRLTKVPENISSISDKLDTSTIEMIKILHNKHARLAKASSNISISENLFFKRRHHNCGNNINIRLQSRSGFLPRHQIILPPFLT